MKTRELLTCNVKTFGNRIDALKPKELRRHIAPVATDLGETDADALMNQVVDTLFANDSMPESASEEMRRVLQTLEERIPVTDENENTVMRLMALCLAFLRSGMRQALREQRLAERHRIRHHLHNHQHGGHDCDDPFCEDHGHLQGSEPESDESPLASGIRSAIG